MELYAERGFEHTTVAEIAKRAGLTERTFFRHYGDKREVLFGGGGEFQERLITPVADAPDSVAPIDAVAAGLESAAAMLQGRREFAQKRAAIIAATPELQERELSKLASMATGIAETLRQRGVDDQAARLIGEVAIAVFRIAFESWLAPGNKREFPELIRESLGQLKRLSAVAG
ncbi:MAG TPA: TetR family transcriptional regulator [Thermoleophilaceae bacterium]|jgi:AcrR family transcriptional regulator